MCELLLPNRIPGSCNYSKESAQDYLNPFRSSYIPTESPDYSNISTDSFDRYYFSNYNPPIDNGREYSDQICNFLQNIEIGRKAPKTTIISKENRAALIDWMLWICYEFGFVDETFFSAVSIIEKILLKIQVNINSLQFYGASAVWIASKLHETQTPSVEDFVNLCNYEYTSNQFCLFEKELLQACNYDIIDPTADNFTSAFLSQIPSDSNFNDCAKMLIHASVFSPSHAYMKPSHIGLAVFTLAKYITRYPMNLIVLPRSLQYFEEDELNSATISLIEGLKIAKNNTDSTFRVKFAEFLQYNSIDIDFLKNKMQEYISTNSLSSTLES